MTPRLSSPLSRRAVLRTAATVGSPVAAGCLGTVSDDDVRTVEMAETDFSPASVTISAGTTVRWVNESDVDHTVTAYGDRLPADADYFASGGFETERAARNDVIGGLTAPGDSYAHAFDRSGIYHYYCIPHESSGMAGTVRVR